MTLTPGKQTQDLSLSRVPRSLILNRVKWSLRDGCSPCPATALLVLGGLRRAQCGWSRDRA